MNKLVTLFRNCFHERVCMLFSNTLNHRKHSPAAFNFPRSESRKSDDVIEFAH